MIEPGMQEGSINCEKVGTEIIDNAENASVHTSCPAATSLQETTAAKTSAASSMERLSAAETLEASPENNQAHPKEEATSVIVCREWETEYRLPAKEQEAACSCIPEKDAVLWQIKDLAAFRAAARVSKIPPLVSPEFGGGCCLRLQLYDKKGHISGRIELPLIKAVKDGVAHFKICVVRPDLKVITTRKVEMRIKSPVGIDRKELTRTSESFRLTKARPLCSARVDRLVIDDALRIRIQFQYFPFDAQIFRGMGKSGSCTRTDLTSKEPQKECNTCAPLEETLTNERRAELLADISSYCTEDSSQYVEIRRGDTVFQRFRDIFRTGNAPPPLTARGSPSYGGQYTRSTMSLSQPALSSVTVQDISTDCLDQMLTYIHTDGCQWLDDHTTDILSVLELFEAADAYGTEHLAARLDRENFVYMFEVSERCNDPKFKQLCAQLVLALGTDFMDSIPGSQVATLMRITSLGHMETPRTPVAA